MKKISVQNITKGFNGNTVLDGINLDVEEGISQVIIGGSGSGKSVLLKCILGLLEVDSGKILVDGEDVTHLSTKDRYQLMHQFGMLFQNGALFDSMSIWQNVGFGLTQQGKKDSYVKDVAIEKLALVGLKKEVADLKPAELSGGMKKRAALARAICLEPDIIFYDEPTTGLDPITSDVINNLIIKLKNELGVTSIVITHDMGSAYKIADSMAMLYKGKMIAKGTVKEIQKSDNPYVEQFIHGKADGPITMELQTHFA
jgi:phospholipid/cholesterol/gamma-HCH transport system ATP-binding protein